MNIRDLILYPTAERVQEVPIQHIKTFEDVGIEDANLIMRPVNRSHVKRLAESKSFPPVEVAHIQHNGTFPFLLVDGKHRLEAAKLLKRQSIEVRTKSYASGEALAEAAIAANLRHGLLSQESKRGDYVVWLYLNGYQDNLEGIAEKTLLSLSVVEHIIEEYLSEDEEETTEVNYSKRLIDSITRYIKMVERDKGKLDNSLQAVEILRYILSLPHAKKSQAYEVLAAAHAIIELVSTMEVVKIKAGVNVTLPEYLSMVLEK
jgi:ParB-like chromosome segregation protein Spo0J